MRKTFVESDFLCFYCFRDSVTLFTECDDDGKVILKKKRPFLIISSTSWTGKKHNMILHHRPVYKGG